MSEVLKKEEHAADQGEHVRQGTRFVPRFDIWESEEELILHGDLPGVELDQLEIKFEDRQLILHGKVDPRHADLEFVGGEYELGDFYRTFNIGEAIDVEKISAELKNGVLTLHLPKSEAIKPRKIEVKAS